MAFVRADASTCANERALAVFDDVGARSNGLQDTDTRQLRQALLDAIEQARLGNNENALDVLETLASVLED